MLFKKEEELINQLSYDEKNINMLIKCQISGGNLLPTWK